MLKGKRFTIAFFVWMGLVTVLSLVSLSESSVPEIRIPHLDKIVHFTFYFVATISGCFFARERTEGQLPITKAVSIFAVVTVVYGIVIEVLQHRFTGTRDGNFYDALANTTGTLIGAGVIFFLFSANGHLKWKQLTSG